MRSHKPHANIETHCFICCTLIKTLLRHSVDFLQIFTSDWTLVEQPLLSLQVNEPLIKYGTDGFHPGDHIIRGLEILEKVNIYKIYIKSRLNIGNIGLYLSPPSWLPSALVNMGNT